MDEKAGKRGAAKAAAKTAKEFLVAQNRDNHPDVMLRKTPGGVHAGKVPNGFLFVVLERRGDDIHVQWVKDNSCQGWCKLHNLEEPTKNLCSLPGCANPSWNGAADEYCSAAHDNDHKASHARSSGVNEGDPAQEQYVVAQNADAKYDTVYINRTPGGYNPVCLVPNGTILVKLSQRGTDVQVRKTDDHRIVGWCKAHNLQAERTRREEQEVATQKDEEAERKRREEQEVATNKREEAERKRREEQEVATTKREEEAERKWREEQEVALKKLEEAAKADEERRTAQARVDAAKADEERRAAQANEAKADAERKWREEQELATKKQEVELARLQVALKEAQLSIATEMEAKEQAEHALQEARRKSEAESELKSCCICMDVEREVLFLPCRHVVCCQDCARSLTKCPVDQHQKCPVCQMVITQQIEELHP